MTACKVAPGDDGWCDERPDPVTACPVSGVFRTMPFGCWCVRPPGHTEPHHCAACCREWDTA